ncbi:MAG: type II toxin-antitoxin system VapC family toxin [Acetobacteraceae bacterium]|nr:type II toxin-antitoxin system VapC family toxin [Acetobacteraceae bacterium]
MGARALILIDTHVLLWAMNEPERLGEEARRILESASETDEIDISAISGWEIAMLADKERIRLKMPVRRWMERAQSALRLRVIPIDMAIAIDAGSLPGDVHGDPGDRLLIATARSLGCPLVTVDRAVLAYGRLGHVRVLDGRL